MNMISTGAFLPETDASTKQSELVKKLTSAWEKKNSKTARAGGASLMALSLAACGGEDNTPFSAADVSAAEAAATTAALTGADGTVYASVDAAVTSNDAAIAEAAKAEVDITTDNQAAIDAAVAAVDLTTDNAAATDAAVAADTAFASLDALVAAYNSLANPSAVSRALTSSTDLVYDLTSSDDTITGAFGTVQSGDVITDGSSSDNDTGSFTVGDDINVTITGVENVTFDIRDTNANSDIILDKVSGANNITLKSSYGTTTIEAESLLQGQKVTFADTDFTSISVNSDGTSDSATNNVHVVLDGAYTATLLTQEGIATVGKNDVDGLTLETKTGASTITLTAADDFIPSTAAGSLDTEYVTAMGDQNLTLVVDQTTDGTGLDGATVNNNMSGDATLTVKLDGGVIAAAVIDLDKVAADTIEIADAAAAASSFDVGQNASIKISVVQTEDVNISTSDEDSTLTLNPTVSLDDDGVGLTLSNFDTININADADAANEELGDILVDNTGLGDTVTLNIATGGGIAADIIGLTSGSLTTLTNVNVTGAGEFIVNETLTATTLDVDTTNTVTLTGNVATTTIDVDTTKAFSAGANVTSAASGTANINAGTSVTITGELTGDTTIVAGTTATISNAINDGLTLTAGGVISLEEVAAGTDVIVLNMTDDTTQATDGSNSAAMVAATVTLNGSGTFATGANVTGNMVVNDAVKLDMSGDTLTGDITISSSKAQTLNVVTGDVTGTAATGAITVASLTGADGTTIIGGAGNDSFTAATANAGASWSLTGGAGNDTLDIGGETTQNGALNGGDGIDTLQGGDGTGDQLTGGSGTDTFEFEGIADGGTLAANDTITDFETGSAGDVISMLAGAEFTSDGASVIKSDTSAAGTTTTDGTDVLLLTGVGYATEAAMLTAINGSQGLAGVTAGDDLLVVYSNTTTGTVEVAQVAETSGDTDFDTATSFVTLSGLSLADITNMTADNFTIA